MAEKKPKKEKIKIATREPQKPKPGIFDELGKGRQQNVKHPFSEIVNFPTETTENTHTTHPIQSNDSLSNPIQPIQASKTKKPVSPINDFQKVPNSIARDAVPNRLFKGTSKNTYDALYLKTRGAVKPVRTIKATKRELMKWIGISHVTIFKHLKHLQSVGLIAIEQQIGSHDGSIYEVFIPEELQHAQIDPSYPIQTHTTHPILSNDNKSNPIQSNKLVWEASNNVVLDRMGNPNENTATYAAPKTSLKTRTKNDDEPFGAMLNTLKRIGKGKAENWNNLAELLEMEFNIAAARTKSVSDAAAFLTEHLRRRLIGKTDLTKPVNTRPSSVKTHHPSEQSANYQAEPLTEEGRQSTLKTFLGYIEKGQRDFLLSLHDSYTKEDWDWLLTQIKENSLKEVNRIE